MAQRDRSPIDQQWVQNYCDEFLKIAERLTPGAFKDAVLLRIDHVMDVLDSWQTRNQPKA